MCEKNIANAVPNCYNSNCHQFKILAFIGIYAILGFLSLDGNVSMRLDRCGLPSLGHCRSQRKSKSERTIKQGAETCLKGFSITPLKLHMPRSPTLVHISREFLSRSIGSRKGRCECCNYARLFDLSRKRSSNLFSRINCQSEAYY